MSKSQTPSVSETFRQALVDAGNLGRVDLDWLLKAGMSADLCRQLQAFVRGNLGAREVVISFLYAVISEGVDGCLPKEVTRLVRRAFMDLQASAPEIFAELVEAIKAVATGHNCWRSLIRDRK